MKGEASRGWFRSGMVGLSSLPSSLLDPFHPAAKVLDGSVLDAELDASRPVKTPPQGQDEEFVEGFPQQNDFRLVDRRFAERRHHGVNNSTLMANSQRLFMRFLCCPEGNHRVNVHGPAGGRREKASPRPRSAGRRGGVRQANRGCFFWITLAERGCWSAVMRWPRRAASSPLDSADRSPRRSWFARPNRKTNGVMLGTH